MKNFRHGLPWFKGVVGSRTYMVDVSNGRVIKTHVDFMRPRPPDAQGRMRIFRFSTCLQLPLSTTEISLSSLDTSSVKIEEFRRLVLVIEVLEFLQLRKVSLQLHFKR